MSVFSSLKYLITAVILCGVHYHILACASPLEERQSSPTIKQTVGTYQYVGCYQDGVNGAPRSLQHKLSVTGGMSAEKCTAACQAAGFVLAGLEFGQECWCDSYFLAPVLVPDTDCKLVCTGDATELCGAGNRLAIYQDTSVPKLTGSVCLTCDLLRRNTGTAAFNLTAQPFILTPAPPNIVTPTGVTPFQIAAVELPQEPGQPTLQELTAFTGTQSVYTFSMPCNNGAAQHTVLETVDSQNPQKTAFAIVPSAGQPLQLVEESNPSPLDMHYCVLPNTFTSRSTFIGPPLLANTGLVGDWGFCEAATLPDGNDHVVTLAPEDASISCFPIFLQLTLIHS